MIVEQVKAEYERVVKEGGRIMAPDIWRISRTYYREIRTLPKHKVFRLCEQLLDDGYSAIPIDWAFRMRKQLAPTDFRRFELWLKTYVDDWGKCDHLCIKPLGSLILQHPELIPRTEKWPDSKNRWVRRASAVCLIPSVRKKQALKEVFVRADKLLLDQDDMVQKGYGWMLKEAANKYPEKVLAFVLKRKNVMPRTSLRYAIEKMPKEWKAEAMKRG